MSAEANVIEHRLRRKQSEVLEGAADADLGDAVGRPPQHRAALEQDIAAVWRVEPADAVEQSRLASTVRSDEAQDLALLDRKGDAVERDNAAEPERDVPDFQQRDGGRRTRSRIGFCCPDRRHAASSALLSDSGSARAEGAGQG